MPGLDAEGLDRIRAMLTAEDLTAAEVHRRLAAGSDGFDPVRRSYPVIQRAVARIRSERPASEEDLTAAGMAGRILRQLDRELARIEASPGRADLERLDRIAATLRRIEPIRPKAEEKKISNLRSLLPKVEDQEPEPQPEGLKDPNLRSEAI